MQLKLHAYGEAVFEDSFSQPSWSDAGISSWRMGVGHRGRKEDGFHLGESGPHNIPRPNVVGFGSDDELDFILFFQKWKIIAITPARHTARRSFDVENDACFVGDVLNGEFSMCFNADFVACIDQLVDESRCVSLKKRLAAGNENVRYAVGRDLVKNL